ncbi:hypothetical protein [Hydrogenophaga palleronii]|uniref:hypothetical protein n=1 Tax=Hydrogenophaga palleronii TaxID=65655 RepID=UPI001C3F3522|nr:hypothetical protein [Hydrogenophaga palleronii]
MKPPPSSTALLERYLPVHQFAERHGLQVAAAPAQLLDQVAPVLQQADPLVNKAIALREAPARLWQKLGGRNALPARPFGLDDFTLLERRGDGELAFGLAGRFWQADYGLHPVANADAFLNLQGVPKLVLHFSASPHGNSTWLSTCTRVSCPDAASLRRFRPYWLLIRPVSGLIRRRLLQRIAAAAT